MGSIACEHCTAACCRYLAIPIDKPKNARDYDDIRWYLLHEDVTVFVEEGDWYVQFQTSCKYVQADNRCGIYETRPAICGAYDAGDCDYSGGDYGYDHLFTHAKQIEELYHQKTGKKLAKSSRDSAPRRRKHRNQREKATR